MNLVDGTTQVGVETIFVVAELVDAMVDPAGVATAEVLPRSSLVYVKK